MSRYALRTRVFAILEKFLDKPIENETDFAKRRRERIALQKSALGRAVFGEVDRRVEVEEIDIPLPGRTLRALIYRSRGLRGKRPVVVNYHGGGWVLGNPEQSGWLSAQIAAQAGVTVIAPSYRLAPEHPYPAAVEDTWAVLNWINEHGDRLRIDTDRLAVMGDSAGGNLAAVLALKARDELAADPGSTSIPRISLQVLIYPSVDMYAKFASEVRMPNAPVLTSDGMRTFSRLYLGDAYGTTAVDVSPLRASSHADLPPAMIVTADRDPLRDNGVFYRDALQAAGVHVDYREYRGTVHGFVSIPGAVPAAQQAANDIADVVAAHIVVNDPLASSTR